MLLSGCVLSLCSCPLCLPADAHPGYNERCAVFEGRRVTELARAVALRDLQRHNIDMLYEYAKYAADKVFEVRWIPDHASNDAVCAFGPDVL